MATSTVKGERLSLRGVRLLKQDYCSVLSKSEGTLPIGTAPSGWDHLLVIELPLPWHRDVVGSALFPDSLRQFIAQYSASGKKVQVQGVCPDPNYSEDGLVRMIHVKRPDNPFKEKFLREEYSVPQEKITPLVVAMMESRKDLSGFARYLSGDEGVRDILVCTHGARDACCGSFGFPIYEALRTEVAEMGRESVRVWRSSHLGGHRLAPTMLDLASGRYWGHLTPDAARAIVLREGRFADVAPHYRGWTGLRSPMEQVAEGAVLEREGWDFIEVPLIESQTASGTVRLTYQVSQAAAVSGTGTDDASAVESEMIRTYAVDVAQTGEVFLPESCGKEPVAIPQYEVTNVT